MNDVVIIIPSRLESSRLKEKPLAKIGNKTIIEHVYEQSLLSGIDTYVATDSPKIASVVESIDGKVIFTEDCPTGTDRVHEAASKLEKKPKYVINLQGDMPFIDPNILHNMVNELKRDRYDIVTPIMKVNQSAVEGQSNVNAVIDNDGKALYFSRELLPHNAEYYWYHLGLYGFTFDSLNKFVNLPDSHLERVELLEQLRALEHGMTIGTCKIDSCPPISIDTQEDLDKAIKHFNKQYS